MKTFPEIRTRGIRRTRWRLVAGVLLLAASPVPWASSEAPAVTGLEDKAFARVGDETITRLELETAIAQGMRKKFYHFQPPEDQRQAFRREVAHEVVTHALLLQEAARRGIEPDMGPIREQLEGYERQYGSSDRWQTEGPQMLAKVEEHLKKEDLLRQLEALVREAEPPTVAQVQQFYADHPDKFTEPFRHRVSLILLTVDPSSTSEAWQAARNKGEKLLFRLRDGADFAELASLHSGDPVSAESGGDMGYLHLGMLSPEAEAVLEGLALGEVSDPVRLLDGIAIFRVEERIEPRLLPLSDVRERAGELLQAESADQAWTALKERLWEGTPVEIFDPDLVPETGDKTSLRTDTRPPGNDDTVRCGGKAEGRCG